ncbi:MAG: copper resistance CopC family protein [Candidatus Binataceae bacterium]
MDAVLMSSAKLLLPTAIGTALLLCIAAGHAHGHAFPASQSPAAGESLTTAPSEIVVRFDSPIEQAFARLAVFDSAGTNCARAGAQVDSSARSLWVRVAPLRPGDYSVSWGVISADGHRTEGSYGFTVRSAGK